MIFIAYNHDGKPISIIYSIKEELAKAFWQGRDIYPYSIKCLERDFDVNSSPTGVFPLFETEEKTLTKYTHIENDRTFLVVK